jgi:hypothetical protein
VTVFVRQIANTEPERDVRMPLHDAPHAREVAVDVAQRAD